MKKRELKQRISELEQLLSQHEAEAKAYKHELDIAMGKLAALGKDFEPIEGVEYVEASAKPWGTYVKVDTDYIKKDKLDAVKNKLLIPLAKGLMDTGWVQFIVKDGLTPLDPGTVGAKLYVVPWEKAVRRRTK